MAIEKTLKGQSRITHLYLSNFFTNSLDNNKLGDMGAVAIGKALEINRTLNVLHLCM